MSLSDVANECVTLWAPPENLTVDQWADKYRRLESGLSAEAGQWRTSRTPYMIEPMRAFTDPKVEDIVCVMPSQVGKSELELNLILYIIDQDPGTIMYVHPAKEDAEDFSTLRVAPLFENCEKIKDKLHDPSKKAKARTANVLNKSFVGGMLRMVGTNRANKLSSTPARYLLGDELDRFAKAAGRDGDPWELAKKRQKTFFNKKRVAVSTPTIKGESQIEFLYNRGTQEEWQTECPKCKVYNTVKFADVRFKGKPVKVAGKDDWEVTVQGWRCPHCHNVISELDVKRAPHRWHALAPQNLEKNRCRSFWLYGFASPWNDWTTLLKTFFEVKNDPERFKVWKNTDLGELWEIQLLDIHEKELMDRAEEYPKEADLPEGPLVLTCGMDVQRTWVEYEVVGWSRYEESWGIQAGIIPGEFENPDVQKQILSIVNREWKFQNGKSLYIGKTLIDSGDGVNTDAIGAFCRDNITSQIFACKGGSVANRPLLSPPKKQTIQDNQYDTYWLYTLGVSVGKSNIMRAVKVKEPGPNFMHFPKDESRGYDFRWFHGLLSEVEEHNGWRKIHERNEPLDTRNYAWAAKKIMNPDFDEEERLLNDGPKPKKTKVKKMKKKREKDDFFE